MISKKSIVVSQLPDAGLGNKLFTWAHGVVFSKKNGIEHLSIGWTKIKIGPILRGEKSKRFYYNYFEINSIGKLISVLIFKKKKVISYKEINDKIKDTPNIFNYYFNEVPDWRDYFIGLRENRNIILEAFFKSLTNKYKKINKELQIIDIGVHIRMGDFRKLAEGHDFSKVGHTRTPLEYFETIINSIRNNKKSHYKVTVFSDGLEYELKQILTMPNVTLADNNNDLIDLIQLSKCKIIILSAGSTFGEWAAFLSNAIIIRHHNHYHAQIRNCKNNDDIYEGVYDENNNTLISQLNNLK